MGAGSRNFAVYYGFLSVLYLVIMAIAFALVASVAPYCQPMCPMLINGGGQILYEACLCNVSGTVASATGYTSPNQSEQDRYDAIVAATGGVLNCYICGSDSDATVYQTCAQFTDCTQPGVLGFQPAAGLIASGNAQCDTQSKTAPASILTSATVANRAFVTAVLYAVAVFYLLQFLCAVLCFAGYFVFKDMYGSDWAHLTRVQSAFAVVCKVAPVVNRLANFGVVFFLLVAVISTFADEVCRYDTNQFDQPVFWPITTGFVAFVGVAWLFTCVFGVLVQRNMPRDTSFYNPEVPTDKNSNPCVRFCCTCCWVLVTFGP